MLKYRIPLKEKCIVLSPSRSLPWASEWNLAEIACVGTRDILGLPDLDQCYLFLGLLGWDFSFRVLCTV